MKIRIDKPLLIIFFILIGIGILLQYSANYPGDQTFFFKHLIWIGISLPVGLLVFFFPVKEMRFYAPILYSIGISLLIVVLALPGSRGRWIEIGTFQFQPSELMKVFLVIMLARIFVGLNQKRIHFPALIPSVLLTAFPTILILLEPDIGTASIIVLIFLGMMLSLGLPIPRYFLYISPILSILCGYNLISWIIFIVIFLVALFFSTIKFRDGMFLFFINIILGTLAPVLEKLLKPYQKERLLSFLNPSWDPTGAGWHILQSKISIGSGGLFGKGYLNGVIKNLGFLPQTRTDFIFSVTGEEFGFVGTFSILLLFGFFLWRILYIVNRTRESFMKYLAFGIFFYFLSEITVNIAMTVGLLPVVGLPLPFLSYGGTSMLVSTIFVGILLSIWKRAYV
ncbi:rod shape-determining protein RodA [candidate division WOR-3 bacterium]|nr:rod shape-determining protein RodA [candidate division WOR-3 bacterium]